MDIHAVAGFFAGIPIDWLIVGTTLVFFILGTLVRGTGYAVALALSLPIASTLFDAAGHAVVLGTIAQQFSMPLEQAVLFLLLTIILLICMYRICGTFDHSSSPLVAIITSVAVIIVVLVTWMQVVSLEALWRPGVQMESIFGESYRLYWLIGAYLALAFSRS
jgi:hypothetical protein